MKSCPACQNLYPANFTVCPKDGVTGIVYMARHLHFDELCALKVVTSHLADEAGFLQRFRAEALVMRKLSHPNAVRVQDFDETEDGRPFMVMEYVEGRSLDKILSTGVPLPPRRAIRITMQAASALGAAHQLGIIHRDIKPANILLSHTAGGRRPPPAPPAGRGAPPPRVPPRVPPAPPPEGRFSPPGAKQAALAAPAARPAGPGFAARAGGG